MSTGVEQALINALRWRAKQCRIAGTTVKWADLPESVQASLWGIASELDAAIEALEALAPGTGAPDVPGDGEAPA